MEEFAIRKIEKKDIEGTAKAYAEAFNYANVGENWSTETAVDLVKYFMIAQKGLFFVAEKEKEIIGGIVAIVKPSDVGKHYLTDTDLFVSPAFHRNGVAKALIRALLKESISNYGITRIGGIANKERTFPMKWYEQIGFKRTRWTYIAGDAKEILRNLEEK